MLLDLGWNAPNNLSANHQNYSQYEENIKIHNFVSVKYYEQLKESKKASTPTKKLMKINRRT